MSLDLEDPELRPLLSRLRPYARDLLARAGDQALRLHADQVSPEHLLSVLMDDPECAAHAAVVHAFADPATISSEALAISPGLMVVASGSTLPFSPLAAEALAGARARARQAMDRAGEVTVMDVLHQAERRLEGTLRKALRDAGFLAQDMSASTEAAREEEPALFKHFSVTAKRMLSAANRLAAGESALSISPAHLFLACLMEDPVATAAAGISFQRARTLLSGRTADTSLPKPRTLAPDPALLRYLQGLEPLSDSLDLLRGFLSTETPELAGILTRSKLTQPFLERGRGAFRDPEGMQEPAPPRR